MKASPGTQLLEKAKKAKKPKVKTTLKKSTSKKLKSIAAKKKVINE